MKTAAWNYDDLWLGSAFSNRFFFRSYQIPYRYVYDYDCRASQTGDAIRATYGNVGVGVVHVPCWCTGAEHNVMFLP